MRERYQKVERPSDPSALVPVASDAAVEVASAEQCGAWGGCSLPHGHNLGRADIPMNHRVPSALSPRTSTPPRRRTDMSDNDAHRYVPAHDGPASCTGCGWESRRIGIASTTQHDAHLEDIARKTAAPITPDERAAMRARHTTSRGAVQRGVASLTDVPRLLDALETAEAEAERLRAEVARVEAERLPAPAWDEAAVIEDMARAANPRRFRDNYTPSRGFGETRSDDELRECAREVERHKMRKVLAAVRENLPVKPSREDVARALYEHVRPGRDAWDRLPYKDDWRAQADAVIDLWLGRSEATVKSEALREARAKLVAEDNDGGEWWDSDGQRYCQPSEWLDARADRIDPAPGSCSII